MSLGICLKTVLICASLKHTYNLRGDFTAEDWIIVIVAVFDPTNVTTGRTVASAFYATAEARSALRPNVQLLQ